MYEMEKLIERKLARFKHFFDAVKIQRAFKRAISDPEYRMCRNRLLREFECMSPQENILSVNYWKNTDAFKSIKDKETQIKFYKKMKSSEEVLQLVDLESKPFGTETEKIIQEILNIGPRTSPQNDGTRNGKKIEIKSARYWAGKDDCVWQHLEPDYDYEYVLFVLLDFHSWKIWGIKKSLLMGELRDKKIVKYQGKQGWWVKKCAIISYLTPIHSVADLDSLLLS
jgi:hypothetical protein